MEEIKAGDVVRLKSGGPLMTAGQPREGGQVPCWWFSGDVLHHDNFQSFVLRIDDTATKPGFTFRY